MATTLIGANIILTKRDLSLKETMHQAQYAMLWACCLLVVSMVCVIGAFASAKLMDLPPIYKYQRNMIGSMYV